MSKGGIFKRKIGGNNYKNLNNNIKIVLLTSMLDAFLLSMFNLIYTFSTLNNMEMNKSLLYLHTYIYNQSNYEFTHYS